MSSEYDPAGERPGRRRMMGQGTPAKVPIDFHLEDAIRNTCGALQLASSRTQAMACWGALRSLLEAKFGLERDESS